MKFYSLLVLGLGYFLIGPVHGQSALADENIVGGMGSEMYGSAEDWQIVGEQLQKSIECRFVDHSKGVNIYTVLKPMFDTEDNMLRDFTYKTVPPASFRVYGMKVEEITVLSTMDEWGRSTATVRIPYAKVQRKLERFDRRHANELSESYRQMEKHSPMLSAERQVWPNIDDPSLTNISCEYMSM